MVDPDTATSAHSTSSEGGSTLATQIPGTVDSWDRSAGEGWLVDEDGDRHPVNGTDVDSPVIEEGDEVKFDIVRVKPGDTRAKRVIVQRIPDSSSSNEGSEMERKIESPLGLDLVVFLGTTAISAGATAIVVGTGLFVTLATLFTSFPVFSVSPVLYVTSVTLRVWGCLFLSSAIGVGVATSYWYSIRPVPMVQDYVGSPGEAFANSFLVTLLLIATVGFLRLLVTIVVALLLLVLILVGPIYFFVAVRKRSFGTVLFSLVMLVFWYAGVMAVNLSEDSGGVLTTEQMATLYGIMTIAFLVIILPMSFGQEELQDLEADVDAFAGKVEQLDNIIRTLDHEMLAQHGLELPYRRAATDSETISESPEYVYVPPFDPDVVEAMLSYYRGLATFESQLTSMATDTGGPTAVSEVLGAILAERHSEVPAESGGERNVVGAAIDIIEAYGTLVEKRDDDSISELATRLDAVHSDVVAGEYGTDSEELAARLDDIRRWTEERTRHADLQSRRADLKDRWPATAGELFGLDIDMIDQLSGSDSNELPLSQLEYGVEAGERVVTIAKKVKTVQTNHQMAILDRLPESFGRYLNAGDINAERLERLEATLEIAVAASETKRRYPSYPFDQVVEHVCAELETGTLDYETDDMIELIESSTEVLDFLNTVDIDHPSVQPDEWRENVHTGLENISLEIVRPLVALVNRMGETLWDQHHLYQFSWEDFERLVASVFESQGYETSVTQAMSDEGVDIWARFGGDRIAIQVKQFDTNNRVGRPTLQKLASTIAKNDADKAIVVTSGEFAQTALEYSADFGAKMRLIDGEELIQMLTESDIPPPLSEQSRRKWGEL